ncbi:MAG: substrate-binding domain-containing protein [Phycisphaerae bacterium]
MSEPLPTGAFGPVRKDVLVQVDEMTNYGRGVLRGVVRYNKDHQHRWQLHGHPHHVTPQVPDPRRWRGHGIIGQFGRDHGLPKQIPTVNVSSANPPSGIPAVLLDNEAIGRLAAEHLLERNLRNFGFVGIRGMHYSALRRSGLLGRLAEETGELSIAEFYLPLGLSHETEIELVRQWIAQLPRPAGIVAVVDALAWRVLEGGRAAGLAVPEQIAVLGVDDDWLLCEVAAPPLSSVHVPSERIGYEAARQLDEMMHGGPRPETPIRLGPTGVTVRRSTNMLAIEDELVARTLSTIRSCPPAEMNLPGLFDALPASRRVIERRFKAIMNRTVWQEWNRHRLQHATELLSQTELSLEQIAAKAGFSDAKQLGAAFRKYLKTTPTALRRQAMTLPAYSSTFCGHRAEAAGPG